MAELIYENTLFGQTPIGIKDNFITLKECSSNKADKVICKYHYSKKATKNRFISFVVNDGLGYLQLGYGIRPAMKHTISDMIKKDNYCV
jgi:hypothetical protein